MLAVLKQNKFLKFLFTSSLVYLALYLFYQFYIKQHTFIDQAFIRVIINSTDIILHVFGYTTFKILRDTDFQAIGIDGSNGVWVGSGCNSITLFCLFAVFIVAYPGHQKSKLWFVPLGILLIHVLNIFRVTALALISLKSPDYLDFNHTYTFTFIVYGFIFLLWMIWVNKYAAKSDAKK